MKWLPDFLATKPWRSIPFIPVLIMLLIAAIWLVSMPTGIAIANDPLPDPTGAFPGILQLMDDSGEFVIAWHTWGITHAPGYPLLGLLSNLGTWALTLFPLNPAVTAHLLSFFFAVGAFLLLPRPAISLDPSRITLAAAYCLPAFGILVWLYAVVAEAYAFGLLLAFATLYTALKLGTQPTTRHMLWLGLLFGLAIGHHRTLLFLGPALLLAAWPARQLGWRVWAGAALLAAATLLIYLYLPLVAWAGSPWVYGRSPTTWAGFSDAFLAREYSARLLPPTNVSEIATMLIGRLHYLAQEMSLAGLLAGVFSFIPGLIQPKTRRLAAVLLLAFGGYWLAPVSQGLLIRSYMMILVASLTLAAAWGIGLTALGTWHRRLPVLGLLISLGIAGYNLRTHQPYIWFHTKDQTGTNMIADAASLPGNQPVVGEVWGPRYFPLAYGRLVTGELADIQLLDLRTDLSGLPELLPEVLFINETVLYAIPPTQWAARYGTNPVFSSQGQQMIAVRATPQIEEQVANPLTAIEDVQLVSAQVALNEDDSLLVQLQWQARQRPERDYHIFVHVSDKTVIAGPDDLIAQGDRTHPVAGFYPTSGWQIGEIVTDHYHIELPPDREPKLAAVGLYTVEADGRFSNHLRYELPLP